MKKRDCDSEQSQLRNTAFKTDGRQVLHNESGSWTNGNVGIEWYQESTKGWGENAKDTENKI